MALRILSEEGWREATTGPRAWTSAAPQLSGTGLTPTWPG
jgi:hypothetical protein